RFRRHPFRFLLPLPRRDEDEAALSLCDPGGLLLSFCEVALRLLLRVLVDPHLPRAYSNWDKFRVTIRFNQAIPARTLGLLPRRCFEAHGSSRGRADEPADELRQRVPRVLRPSPVLQVLGCHPVFVPVYAANFGRWLREGHESLPLRGAGFQLQRIRVRL